MTIQNHSIRLLPLALIAFTMVTAGVSNVAARSELSPSLGKMASDSSTLGRNISVLVFLDGSSVASEIQNVSRSHRFSRDERIRVTTTRLRERRHPAEGAVSRFLNQHSSIPVRRLWITPAFAATIPASAIEPLSALDGIRLIIPDVDLELVAPVSMYPAPTLAAAVPGVLSLMNVPSVWRRGLTGKGRLVCSFDTGVEGSHPALAGKWRGTHASLRSTWFSTIKPDTLPYDKAGHGTHTMGIMVGSTPIDSFGVAPEAEWITAGVIDQGKSLNLTIGDILLAFQWALDPDGNPATTDDVPDVILNSWGIPKGIFPACDATFSTAIENVEAAGIVTVFAAGNEGPNPSTLRQPADNANSPLNSFAVGAVDSFLNVAAFSSRGPSYCDTSNKKPELVAPGVGIRSSTKGGAYVYMSGTSMAAPFVAGVVALLRQFNPDATVDEIKSALLLSARDIGVAGEDNASGHGFIDASRALDFMPLPPATVFVVAHKSFTANGVAMPGLPANLSLTLTNSTGTVSQIDGRLVPLVAGTAAVGVSQSTFSFGQGGTTAIASPEFTITFDTQLPHGATVPFRLYLGSANGPVVDSLDLSLVSGMAPVGNIATLATSRLTVGVSDFGQYGLASGSIYNAGGAGFHFQGGPNLLYEAGVVIGRNSLQLSSAIRDSAGQLRSADFVPIAPLTSSAGSNEDQYLNARFVDGRAEIPIPITISQETVVRNAPGASDILLVRYNLINNSPEKLTGLRFGFLSDFDLSDADTVGFEAGVNLVWQRGVDGPFIGLVGLKNIGTFRSVANGATKTGFTKSQLFSLISTDGVGVGPNSGSPDQMLLLASSAIDLFSGDSSEVAFAIVAAENLTELFMRASEAQTIFNSPTDVNDPADQLPSGFSLEQNYPNPFNPSTTISFALAKPAQVSLTIFNLLGQEVRTLIDGPIAAGSHSIQWDGHDSRGHQTASGVYLYRLTAGSSSKTRKMVLVR